MKSPGAAGQSPGAAGQSPGAAGQSPGAAGQSPVRTGDSEALLVFLFDAAVDAGEVKRSATVIFDDQICIDVGYVDATGAVINYYAATYILHGDAAGTIFY
jgi:hypothetical protein